MYNNKFVKQINSKKYLVRKALPQYGVNRIVYTVEN